jgi:hypothetical protein
MTIRNPVADVAVDFRQIFTIEVGKGLRRAAGNLIGSLNRLDKKCQQKLPLSNGFLIIYTKKRKKYYKKLPRVSGGLYR